MAILKLNELEEGMVVASPVTVDGRVVLGAGAAITPKILKLFESWGIAEIEVEGGEDAIELTEEEKKQLDDYLTNRFKFVDMKQELMQELKQIVLKLETDKLIQAKKRQT